MATRPPERFSNSNDNSNVDDDDDNNNFISIALFHVRRAQLR